MLQAEPTFTPAGPSSHGLGPFIFQGPIKEHVSLGAANTSAADSRLPWPRRLPCEDRLAVYVLSVVYTIDLYSVTYCCIASIPSCTASAVMHCKACRSPQYSASHSCIWKFTGIVAVRGIKYSSVSNFSSVSLCRPQLKPYRWRVTTGRHQTYGDIKMLISCSNGIANVVLLCQ